MLKENGGITEVINLNTQQGKMKGIKYSEALKEDLEDFREYETDEKKAKLGERIFF
ncbi:MAG: hypothetical protein QXH91_04205 [Candidatus Bathyarchaeia archaeon]